MEDPTAFMDTFRSWRRGLRVNNETPPQTQMDRYGSVTLPAIPAAVYVLVPLYTCKAETYLQRETDDSIRKFAMECMAS